MIDPGSLRLRGISFQDPGYNIPSIKKAPRMRTSGGQPNSERFLLPVTFNHGQHALQGVCHVRENLAVTFQ